jgi:hypothetical protein
LERDRQDGSSRGPPRETIFTVSRATLSRDRPARPFRGGCLEGPEGPSRTATQMGRLEESSKTAVSRNRIKKDRVQGASRGSFRGDGRVSVSKARLEGPHIEEPSKRDRPKDRIGPDPSAVARSGSATARRGRVEGPSRGAVQKGPSRGIVERGRPEGAFNWTVQRDRPEGPCRERPSSNGTVQNDRPKEPSRETVQKRLFRGVQRGRPERGVQRANPAGQSRGTFWMDPSTGPSRGTVQKGRVERPPRKPI